MLNPFMLGCLLAGAAHLLCSAASSLSASIGALNLGLGSQTNIIYLEALPVGAVFATGSECLQVPTLLYGVDYTRLLASHSHRLDEPILVILANGWRHQALDMLQQLPLKLQTADLLIVSNDSLAQAQRLLADTRQLGYANALFYQTELGQLYSSPPYVAGELQRISVGEYLWWRRHWFDNLHGHEVRVALYNNPPRTLVYPAAQLYDGYALMLLRQFLAYRGATFVPVLTPNYEVYSANDCMHYLQSNRADLCGDLLAYTSNYSFTASYMYLYGNILIPNAQPIAHSYYILAPFQLSVWLLLASYLCGVSGYATVVCWWQQRRLYFGKFLLDLLRSLLYVGFRLREISGRTHYILFTTFFLAGFMYYSVYVATLGSILATGLYEPQINTFEQLVRQNISIVIGDYDKTVLQAYDYPDILWNITRVVPYDFILAHRRVFDTNYAYLAHSDRIALFDYQQQFMAKPRMRRLPIDLMHSLPGFPMRRSWLLKHKLSETLLNCFSSGLMQKLADDTNRLTIHIGYLNLIPSQPYEAQALRLDFYAVALLMLGTGLGMAFVCLLGELLLSAVRPAAIEAGTKSPHQ